MRILAELESQRDAAQRRFGKLLKQMSSAVERDQRLALIDEMKQATEDVVRLLEEIRTRQMLLLSGTAV